MSEQLNERERWLIEVSTAHAWGCGGAMEPLPTTKELIDKIMRRSVDCPPDPRDAELSALRAEVERLREKNFALHREADLAWAAEKKVTRECLRLNGLLDEAFAEADARATGRAIKAGLGVSEADSFMPEWALKYARRTAERKERGDG